MKAHREGQTLADPTGSRDADLRGTIALDAAFARARSGIGTYSRHLIAELRRGPLAEKIVALAPRAGASRSLWLVGEVERELRRARAALFHGLANFDLPLRKPSGTRFVLTVHDLIPLERPEAVSRAYRLQFGAWLTRSLELADAVVCPTAGVAEAVRGAFARAPPATVIPLGVRVQAATRSRPEQPLYFLAVGSIEIRKNLTLLLHAFEANAELWRREKVELWVAGPAGYGAAAVVAELKAAGAGVRWLGPQSARELTRLVRNAMALCAPSLAEGFGLPPLEALAVGTPVLASDIPAHREVLGEAAQLVPAREVEAWAAAMSHLALDRDFRAALGGLGPARAAEFTWSRTARRTEGLYRALLS